MATLNFNAANVAPSEVIEAVPAGWYNAVIDNSELKPTKDGSGAYLEVRFSVMDGQYVNRKIFKRLNIKNNSAQAQEIAYRELSSICHAIGRIQVSDSHELHGVPLKIKVTVRAASGDYEASNDIRSYKNINEPTPATATATAFAPPAAPWSAQSAPPAFGQPAAPAPAAPPAWQQPMAQQPWATTGAPTPPPAAPTAPAGQAFPSFNIPPAESVAPAQSVPTMQPVASQPDWANNAPQQGAAPTPSAPAAPAPAPAEPHPAQSATPPWMKTVAPAAGAATPPWNQ